MEDTLKTGGHIVGGVGHIAVGVVKLPFKIAVGVVKLPFKIVGGALVGGLMNNSSSDKIHVPSYHRKDGTFVKGHDRRK